MAIAIIFDDNLSEKTVNQKPVLYPNLEETYIMNKITSIKFISALENSDQTEKSVVTKGVNFAMSSAKTNGTLYLRDSQIIQIWS